MLSAWTFCPTKTKIVQTNVNFGRKMSDVRPLFQALGSDTVYRQAVIQVVINIYSCIDILNMY